MRESSGRNGSLPPWEAPGAVRRDCEPHHGSTLRLLAGATVALTVLAFCGGFSAGLGLLLSVVTYVMARHDLRQMTQGIMDPAGRSISAHARTTAAWCALVNVLWLGVWGLIYASLIAIPRW